MTAGNAADGAQALQPKEFHTRIQSADAALGRHAPKQPTQARYGGNPANALSDSTQLRC